MRRAVTVLGTVLGVVAIFAGVVLAVLLTPVTAEDAGAGAAIVALVGVGTALWKLWRSGGDEEGVAPAPWTDEGALADGVPEETGDPAAVTGTDLATVVDDATERARSADTVEEGFEVVRPALRETLGRVLVQSGTDSDAVEDVLASGEWTDDRVAAAVVDANVERPRLTLRERLRAWLFPERVVRTGTARAVDAIAAAADEKLPPVVGQRTPRSDPVVAPPIASLQRAVDGTLQPARATEGPNGDEDRTSGDDEGSNGDDDGPGSRSVASGSPSDDDGTAAEHDVVEVWDDA